MSELDPASNGGLGLTFFLSEIRDLRKGLEARDERINVNIDGLRNDVNTLSTSLIKSQDHVTVIESDVKSLKDDMRSVRHDVNTIMSERRADMVRADSAWSGPKKVMRNLALTGSGLGGLAALWYFFGPAFLALISAE